MARIRTVLPLGSSKRTRTIDHQTTQYDYRYDDTDTLMNELEEFYPYVEVPLLAEGPKRFKKVFPEGELGATAVEVKG